MVFVDFSIAEAQRYADLTGVEHDLVETEKICARLLSEYAKPEPEEIIVESLCAAAIIRYGRTFPSGVRAGVTSEVIDALDSDLKSLHRYFKDLRDKWIAHSVNCFEENRVLAYLAPEKAGVNSVAWIVVQQNRVAGLGSQNINKLKMLCETIRKHLSLIITQEKDELLKLARSLPASYFVGKEGPDIFVPGQGNPSKSRRKLGS